MRRFFPAVVAALCAVICIPASAGAVTIHQHLTIDRVLGPPITVTRVVMVAPPDTDDDGCPDQNDHWAGSGCNAPPAPAPVASATSVVSSGSCPASLAGESTSPTAVNGESGASGCIQALPSTWDAYGDPAYPEASDAPVSVQMAALARICAAQGNDAWVAADPC